MKIAGEHRFGHSRDEVWRALNDPDALAACLPGARSVEPTGPDEYAITVDVGVGSVKGTYQGTFALSDKVQGESCTVRASGSGRPGSVSVQARMQLDGDGVLTYDADANVTGPLAGVGQRLIAAAARRTTGQFLDALDKYIAAPAPAAAAAEAQPRREIERARPAAAADVRVIVASALGGFALALVGVAVGRWTARR